MVKDVLLELLPPDIPRLVRWRLTIALAIAMLFFHVAWACGLVPGVPGFARADEVDEKIGEKLKPLYEQVGQIAKQQADTDEVVKEIRADQLAQRIRELQALRCTNGNRFIGVNIFARLFTEKVRYAALHQRHASLTTDQNHIINLRSGFTRIFQCNF